MHRALVIQLGEALAPTVDRLRRECEARDARVEFLDAPPAAVGNLTNPVEVLRENLEADLASRLTDLLRLSTNADGEFVLDVFVVVNLGEPLVANAATVIIDMVLGIVDSRFRAIFPRHRIGPARRFRIIPIALLPAADDCKKDRSDAFAELRALHDTFKARRDEAEFPVDRFFLLDAITSRGIAPIGDLLDQVGSFLRLVSLSGLRRHVDFVNTFESACSDLFASFGIACCEVDFIAVRQTLSAKMTKETAEALAEDAGGVLPPVTELLPVSVLDDSPSSSGADGAFDRVLEELGSLPLRTLRVDGSGAVRSLRDLYTELLERIAGWREVEIGEGVTTEEEAGEADRLDLPWKAIGGALLAGLVLGGIVHAIAYFVLELTPGASTTTAGGFAFVAAVLVGVVVWTKRGGERRRTGRTERESFDRGEVLDALEHVVAGRRTKLVALVERFDAIAEAFAGEEPVAAPEEPGGTFRDQLVNEALLQLLYEQRAAAADVRSLADRWLLSIGEWSELLEGEVQADAAGLEAYCREHFSALGGQPLFAQSACRECVGDVLERFVDKWRRGVPVFLEAESRKQFDPDGFYAPFSSVVVRPADLAGDIGAFIRADDAVLRASDANSLLDDVFVISVVADVHPDAIAALTDRT